MAIPDGAVHYVVSGTAASAEAFAFGWWIMDPEDSAGVDLDAVTEWSTFRTALLTHWESDQIITQYDTYRYEGGVVSAHQSKAVSHAGTDTFGGLPLQVSMVLTLRSATLSRQGRGRIYLPIGASSMMSTGHLFDATAVATLVDDFAAYLTEVTGAGRTPSVISRVGSTAHTITSVDADLVPDTQRRRRNKLTSARHSHAV